MITANDTAIQNLMQAEKTPNNIVLNDWTHELSDVAYARYLKTGAYPFCVNSILFNGKGRIECLPPDILAKGPGLGIGDLVEVSAMMPTSEEIGTSGLKSFGGNNTNDIPAVPSLSPQGCTPNMFFMPGYNASSQPPESCSNTTSDLTVIPANPENEWVALNFINAGSVSALTVSIDSHVMWIYAVDGFYVVPQKYLILTIQIGERYQVMVPLTQTSGNFYIRAATYPTGTMQQVLQSKAILSYEVRICLRI